MELEEFQAHACACESAIVQGVFIYDRRLSCFCHVFSGLNHYNEHTFMYVFFTCAWCLCGLYDVIF